MLEGLKTIDWHQLSHAYGEADDVPRLIKALASKNEKKRGNALNKLYTNIYHQGTVYQASAYAAPFLIELLENDAVSEKGDILMLLTHLAWGNAYYRQHMRNYDEKTRQSPEFQAQLAEEIFWVDKTHAAVREGLKTYLRLLRHDNIQVRMHVVFLLAWFESDASLLIPPLQILHEEETDQRLRACILMPLGQLAGPHSVVYQHLIDLVTTGETELVRLTAAIAIVRMGCDDTPLQAVDLLLSVIARREAFPRILGELPWSTMDLLDPTRVLCCLRSSAASYAIRRLVEMLEALDSTNTDAWYAYEAYEIVETLLYLAFRGTEVALDTRAEHLTEEQLFVLRTIVQLGIVWISSRGGCESHRNYLEPGEGEAERFEMTIDINNGGLLSLGLPYNRRRLRTFLQMEPQEGDMVTLLATRPLTFEKLVQLNPQYSREQLQDMCKQYPLIFDLD